MEHMKCNTKNIENVEVKNGIFESGAINQPGDEIMHLFCRMHGLPAWGAARPSVLMGCSASHDGFCVFPSRCRAV